MNFTNPHIILVTGASGFIGSALLPKLLSGKFEVRILGKCSASLDIKGIKQFDKRMLDSRTFLDEPLQGVRTVIHLAARVHMTNDRSSLETYRRDNLEMTMHLARQAASARVKRFIFMSTIAVNGKHTSEGGKFHADDTPNPQNSYGISKREAEAGLIKLAKETEMEVVIIRAPLVYGPGVKANFLKMIEILYAGVPLPFGNVNNKRSLVFIDNLVDLIIKIIDHPGVSGEIFLVSDDNDVSTSRLLNALSLGLRGHKARLIPLPESLLKIIFKVSGKSSLSYKLLDSLQLDIEKTKTKLDWAPLVTFDRGIKITVDSYLNSFR
jgi:UDP-glucose 4-epimerase